MRPEFLRRLAETDRSASAPLHIKQALRGAVRARQDRATVIVASPRRARGVLYALAAAAALVLFSLAYSWERRSADAPVVTPPAHRQSMAQVPAPAPSRPTPVLVDAAVQRPVPRRTPPARNAVHRVTPVQPRELVTQFYALTADAGEPMPGSQLLRVRLPRSAMGSFGLPVDMDRANAQINADVIVGQDGIARAVRFVHGYSDR